jgi:hypothetical protein
MMCEAIEHVVDAAAELIWFDNVAQESRLASFLGRQHLGEKQHALGAPDTEFRKQTRIDAGSQAIAKGPCDWNAKARRRRCYPQVASACDCQAAADTPTFDDRKRRNR